MKLISTIFTAPTMEFTLTVQNRNQRNAVEIPQGPLITKHVSKIGNESLIFNPSVAIVIRGKGDRGNLSAFITQTTFYRFVTSLTTVYQGLSTGNLYHQEGVAVYLDRKKAAEVARRISLYRNALTIIPGLISQSDGSTVKGVELMVDNSSLGVLSHLDVLSLLAQLEHFDMTTFALLAGVVDELEATHAKLSTMDMKLDQILAQLQSVAHSPTEPQRPMTLQEEVETMLNWENVDKITF